MGEKEDGSDWFFFFVFGRSREVDLLYDMICYGI